MPSTFTYDNTQVASPDVIKFYTYQKGNTADGTEASRDFDDEEIAAVFARATLSTIRANEYFAAVELLNSVIVKYGSTGKGRDAGRVGKLNIIFGGRSTKLETLILLAERYEKLAAKYSRVKPRAVRLVNSSGARR